MARISLNSMLFEDYGIDDKDEIKDIKETINEEIESFSVKDFLAWQELISKYDIELPGGFQEDFDLYVEYYNNDEVAETNYKLFQLVYDENIYEEGYSEFKEVMESQDEINFEEYKDFLEVIQSVINSNNLENIDMSFESSLEYFDKYMSMPFEDDSREAFKLMLCIKDTIDVDITFDESQAIFEKFSTKLK